MDFGSRKVPEELLIEIIEHGHPGTLELGHCQRSKFYPVALTQVCRRWRTVVLGAPTLWANIRIARKYSTEQIKDIIHTCLERSKMCPISLTWYWRSRTDDVDIIRVVLDHLIVPYAERMQRITVLIDDHGQINIDAFLAVTESLDFPILRDVEIFSDASSTLTRTLGRNVPLLRRCRLHCSFLLQPLPSNLVVLDHSYPLHREDTTNIHRLLEFLPHVAHSLEHLRSRLPLSKISFSADGSKINLQNLKSLIVENNHIIMDHILVPNLIYFAGLRLLYEGVEVDKMFNNFSAPKLQSIRFYKTPLSCLLAQHEVLKMFSQLESVVLVHCGDESSFIQLLEPLKPEEPFSLGGALENPFPNLKELAISDTKNWTSLLAMIEKRLKNNNKSLRKVLFPQMQGNFSATDISLAPMRWLSEQGIEHVVYNLNWAQQTILSVPPEFQDNFWNKERFNERLSDHYFSR